MLQLIKNTLRLLLFMMLFAFLSVILTLTLIDPNEFKGPLEHVLSNYTDQTVIIDGSVSLEFVPWTALKITQVKIKNHDLFETDDLADIGELNIAVKLLPLLYHQVRIRNITINNAKIHLIKDENSRKNWRPIKETIETAQPEEAIPAYPMAVNISKFEMKNTEFTWDNRKAKTTFHFKHLNFRAQPILLPDPPKLIKPSRYTMARKLTLSGLFHATEFILDEWHASNISCQFRSDHGELQLSPIHFNLANGKGLATLLINFNQDKPLYQITLRLNKVQDVKKIFNKIPFTAQSASLNLSGKARGDNSSDINQTLNIKGHFYLSNGFFDIFNLPYFLDLANQYMLTNQMIMHKKERETTLFDHFYSDIVFQRGLINFSNTQLKSNDFDMTGYGRINLKDHTQQYHIGLEVTNPKWKELNQTIIDIVKPELKRKLPLYIHGPLKRPLVDLDYELLNIQQFVLGKPMSNFVNYYDINVLTDTYQKIRETLQEALHKAMNAVYDDHNE